MALQDKLGGAMTRWRAMALFARDQSGAVSILTALALPALIGTLALGSEVSYWLLASRKLQNAADSAVIAASIDASPSYLAQAKAVAARYGLVDGVNAVQVTGSNAAHCPTGGDTCYSVTIATALPNYLGGVIGYVGRGSANGVSGTKISAIAFAKPSGAAHEYCLVALGTGSGDGVAASGVPMADLSGCGVMSNSSESCKGHDLGAAYGDAVGTNSGCGAVQTSGVKPFPDPYANLASKLPADACGGTYPQSPSASVVKWSGTRALGSTTTICGDLVLTGDVAVASPSDAVLIIRNGQLLTQGYRFTTSTGSGLAVVFTGTNASPSQHIPSGSGSLDFAAPTTGTWEGVAMYQDPALTSGVQMTNAASSPTWAISGLIYLPHVDLMIKGSIGKSVTGKRCTVIVSNTITIKGTGLVLSTVDCGVAGLMTPTNGSLGRGVLVG